MLSVINLAFSGIFHPTPIRRSKSFNSAKTTIGDLSSGRAFDNGCVCHQSSEGMFNDLVGRQTECHCGAPRLQCQLEFVRALMTIGKKLQPLPNKEMRSKLTSRLFTHYTNKLPNVCERCWCHVVTYTL